MPAGKGIDIFPFCSETRCFLRPILFFTFPRLLKFLFHFRIVVLIAIVFGTEFESWPKRLLWPLLKRTKLHIEFIINGKSRNIDGLFLMYVE